MKVAFAAGALVSFYLSTLTPVAHAADDQHFARRLVCRYTDSHDPEIAILYTRLDQVKSKSQLPIQGQSPLTVWHDLAKPADLPKADEVAQGWIGYYYGAWVNQAEYHYSLTTCDTEDREYVFNTQSLLVGQKESEIHGKVTISIRSDTATHDLTCKAE